MIGREKLLRQLARKLGPLFERAGHAGDVPERRIDRFVEHVQILRSQNPGVVRACDRPDWRAGHRRQVAEPTGTAIASLLNVKGLFGLHKIEQMGMAARVFTTAMHAERVIPDDPVANRETDLPSERDLEFGCVLIPDNQPERAVWFEHAINFRGPGNAPLFIIGGGPFYPHNGHSHNQCCTAGPR